jgi:hypothetical protein
MRLEVASSLSYCGQGTGATPTDAAGRLRETARPMVVAQVSLLPAQEAAFLSWHGNWQHRSL